MNLDYVLAAVLFVFMVTVLLVLWRREHPRNRSTDWPSAPGSGLAASPGGLAA